MLPDWRCEFALSVEGARVGRAWRVPVVDVSVGEGKGCVVVIDRGQVLERGKCQFEREETPCCAAYPGGTLKARVG